MSERKDTSVGITVELAEALDKALEAEHKRGNKYIRSRSQLAIKWLWERHRDWLIEVEAEKCQRLEESTATV